MPQLFDQLREFLSEVENEKQASVKKQAEANTEPSSQGGPTSHPSKSVDDNTQPATEGKRSQENASDVKKTIPTGGVDSSNDKAPSQEDQQLNVGITSTSTGNDPANEDNYKDKKEDPGTTHPAKMEGGEKYSSMSFVELRKLASEKANNILADVVKLAEMGEKKVDSDLKGDQHKLDVNNNGKIEGSDLAALREGKAAAFKAGYELAEQLGLNKEAAEAAVRDVCANTIREADEMADLFIGFVTSKSAAADPTEEATEGEDHSGAGDDASGASDAPAEGGAAPAGLEAMMGAEGGGDMGPEAAGGEPSEDEAVQELAMALEELGIPPEALLHALSGHEGGAAPEAGAAPAAPPAEEPKMAAAKDLDAIGRAVVNFKRAGKFQVKEARTKRSRQLRDMMKQHVLELVNR